MNTLTTGAMVRKMRRLARWQSREEAYILYMDIADEFKEHGILPKCAKCGLNCIQHNVPPSNPLTNFVCPLDIAELRQWQKYYLTRAANYANNRRR